MTEKSENEENGYGWYFDPGSIDDTDRIFTSISFEFEPDVDPEFYNYVLTPIQRKTKIRIHFQDFIEAFLVCLGLITITLTDYLINEREYTYPLILILVLLIFFLIIAYARKWKFIFREVEFE